MLAQQGPLTAWVFPASSLSAWGKRAPDGTLVPSRASEALAANPRARAVLDGSMFSLCSSGGYARADCADLDYLLRGEGVSDGGENPTDGLTISVTPAGTARVLPGAAVVDGARVAVQLYPTLVRDGAVIVSNRDNNADRVWRAALGVMADGRLVFAIMVADMQTFARALIAFGVRDAGYTDGGGSASLAVRGDQRYGASEDRRVASWLLAYDPAPPAGLPSPFATVAVAAALGALTYAAVRLAMR